MRFPSARIAMRGLALAAAIVGGCHPAEPPIQKKVEHFKAYVTKFRGLGFTRPIRAAALTKEEFRDLLEREVDKELPPEKAGQYARGYAKFGVIPKDLDLRKSMIELMVESAAAFYNPRTKELKVLKEGSGKKPAEIEALKRAGIDIEGSILVHELTHAGQDQAFDLSTLPLDSGDNDDLSLALKSLIEGDASAVGWRYALGDRFDPAIGLIDQAYKTGSLPGKAGDLPPFLRLTLTFPYGFGTDFVLAFVKRNGGSLRSISKLFRDLPLSSEQILHPEKYLDERDDPIQVTLPDVARLFGPPWKESYQNVHGEYSTFLILREFQSPKLPLPDIRRASEGWGGDRYCVLEDDAGHTAYVWYTTWDTESDAKEFYEAYTLALQKKYDQPLQGPATDRRTRFQADGGWVALDRRGRDVLVLDGVNEEILGMSDAVFSGSRKAMMKSFERASSEPAPCRHPRMPSRGP